MATPIQHLNVIVDPLGSFLLAAADPFDTGTNPVAVPDPSSNNAAGGSSDPGNPLVRNPGRQIRPGGSGVQPNRHIGAGAPVPPSPPGPPPPPPPPPPPLGFVQDLAAVFDSDSVTPAADDAVTFAGNVTAGNLVVLAVRYVGDSAAGGGGPGVPVVTGLHDSFGTVYALAGSVVNRSAGLPPGYSVDPCVVFLYYGVAAATGFCTVTYTITSTSPPGLGLRYVTACEYRGVSRAHPLDHTATDGGQIDDPLDGVTYPLSPGPVVTTGTGGLIVLAVYPNEVLGSGTTYTAASDSPAGANLRGGFGPPPLAYAAADFFPCPASGPGITPALKVVGPAFGHPITWAAIAASFNKA